jgi:hypothetical protein
MALPQGIEVAREKGIGQALLLIYNGCPDTTKIHAVGQGWKKNRKRKSPLHGNFALL